MTIKNDFNGTFWEKMTMWNVTWQSQEWGKCYVVVKVKHLIWALLLALGNTLQELPTWHYLIIYHEVSVQPGRRAFLGVHITPVHLLSWQSLALLTAYLYCMDRLTIKAVFHGFLSIRLDKILSVVSLQPQNWWDSLLEMCCVCPEETWTEPSEVQLDVYLGLL